MANALTAVRFLLIAPVAWLVARGDSRSASVAAVLFIVAVATDLLDGPVARRAGSVSAVGGTFDHLSDFLFVTSGLAAAALNGAIPWILPVLISAAFAQYWIDSYWVHRHRALRGSRLGRWNGILYFVPLGLDILVGLGFEALRSVVTAIAWTLVVTTLVSMILRLRSTRTVHDSPAAETASQYLR